MSQYEHDKKLQEVEGQTGDNTFSLVNDERGIIGDQKSKIDPSQLNNLISGYLQNKMVQAENELLSKEKKYEKINVRPEYTVPTCFKPKNYSDPCPNVFLFSLKC